MILPVSIFLAAQTEAAKMAIDKNISFEEASDIIYREKEKSRKDSMAVNEQLLHSIYNGYKAIE